MHFKGTGTQHWQCSEYEVLVFVVRENLLLHIMCHNAITTFCNRSVQKSNLAITN